MLRVPMGSDDIEKAAKTGQQIAADAQAAEEAARAVQEAGSPEAAAAAAQRVAGTAGAAVQHAGAAGQAAQQAGQAALGELCSGYWPPLYAWARRRGLDGEAAQELVQDFFAALLGGDSLRSFDHGRGRFRSWLLAALQHHDARRREHERAAKRGGGAPVVVLDAELAERVHAGLGGVELTAEQAYERAWARAVLDRVEVRLRSDYAARGAEAELDALAPVVLRGASTPYASVATALGRTEGAIKVAAHRLRKRYGELLRVEVADTVASPGEVEDELRSLIRASQSNPL